MWNKIEDGVNPVYPTSQQMLLVNLSGLCQPVLTLTDVLTLHTPDVVQTMPQHCGARYVVVYHGCRSSKMLVGGARL